MNTQVQQYQITDKGMALGMVRVAVHMTLEDYAALCVAAHRAKKSISQFSRETLRTNTQVQA